MIPDKKTKRKNILTAVAIIGFMIFLFFLHFIIRVFLIDQYSEK